MQKVGKVTVGDDVIHRVTYEVARWYRDVKLDAGDYDLFATWVNGKVQFHAKVEGTVVAADTSSSFGGVVYGSEPQGKNHRDVGDRAEVVLRLGGYVGASTKTLRPVNQQEGRVYVKPDPFMVYVERTYFTSYDGLNLEVNSYRLGNVTDRPLEDGEFVIHRERTAWPSGVKRDELPILVQTGRVTAPSGDFVPKEERVR